jgi:hypothetical protein
MRPLKLFMVIVLRVCGQIGFSLREEDKYGNSSKVLTNLAEMNWQINGENYIISIPTVCNISRQVLM